MSLRRIAAAQAGFRPGDPDAKAQAPIDAAQGADSAQPTRVLSLPQPDVLARVKAAWREDRKPANVTLASEGSTVRVYTIAYGREANESALEAVAQASGGKAFTGDPKRIESVYRSIWSPF